MSDTDELLLSSYDTDEDNAAPSDSTVDDTDTRQARVDALLESIASIPPIVDILLSNLSYKDNLACLHVCKLWSSIAQGYLWRHVRFRFEGALTPAQNAIIRSRVHRIRSLTTPLADTTFLDMPCTQLKSLEIWPGNLTAPDFLMGLHHEAETPLQTPHVGPSALDLIPMNRHLSSISFKQIEYLSRSFTPELFLSFSQLPLQSLLLGITWHVSETLPLAAFLAHCPTTLERLELSYDRRHQRFSGQFLDEVSMTSEQAAQLPWSPLPVLKTLKISPSFPIRDATMVVLPLLRHCPNLEELWMPPLPSVVMATEFFNLILRNSLSIKTLRLSPPCEPQQLGWYPGSLSQDLLRVANTYRGLREVELEVKIQEEYPVIPTLVFNSGWSLEIIDLSCHKPELGIFKNPYVMPILKNCSRLKRLAINGQGRGKDFVSLRDLVEINWASNQLESLTVVVSEMGKEYRANGWFVEKFVNYQEDNEQLQEDIAMLLFQLSMKYRAQKNYMGPIPAWLEAEAVLLPFAAAVKHTDGAMSLAAWKRIRPVNSEPLCNV
ncbi:hypothetical protein EC957_012105 [Mortierella hygrophila]|uniref:F-box domain-containing protein n=1 Tax=Mortierella hygrophila TaxID=979708 RepID=A0A9P6K3C5_9FUNG|nr:hypothetical protein EC957_012105 [Mortierella hygrophila]